MYDAMRSPRFYGRVLSQEEALAELETRYKLGWFDGPLWVAAKHTFEEYNHSLVGHRAKQGVVVKGL
jgi:HD-GYP domain-containing protein (c-di-GMP phosphodiesterase class II)